MTHWYLTLALLSLPILHSSNDDQRPRLSGLPGDAWEYNLDVSKIVGNNAVGASLRATVKHEVLASNVPGQILVRQTTTTVLPAPGVGGPGGPSSPIPTVPITVAYRPDGSVANIVGTDVQPAAYRLANLQTIKLPDVPLKLNLSWNWHPEPSRINSGVPVEAKYRIVGDEVASGFDSWKIEFSTREAAPDEATGAPAARMSGTVWLRKSDSRLLGLEDYGYNLPVPYKDASVRVNQHSLLSYVPDAEKRASASDSRSDTAIPPTL